jgi:amicyanin
MKRAWLALLAVAAAAPLGAQSLLYRPANLGGTWVPDAGVVQFNFVHRFYAAPAAGSHKITNYPTFTFALGLGHAVAIGTHYGTNSLVVLNPYRPNETELYTRWRLRGAEGKDGIAVSITPAYNVAAHSADGELSVDYTIGRLTVSGAARGMTKAFGLDTARAAFAGGFVARLTQYIAVSADLGSFVSPSTRAAWSVALDFLIPSSPHTFSLQASNATTSTIQGNSVGNGKMLYGFEFTIPLHLKRFSPWFHATRRPKLVVPEGAAVVKIAQYKFATDTVRISAGAMVVWVNDDVAEHTVTFDGTEPGSPTISPGGTFSHRFDRPGTYPYHCTPHPFMKGVVVVK